MNNGYKKTDGVDVQLEKFLTGLVLTANGCNIGFLVGFYVGGSLILGVAGLLVFGTVSFNQWRKNESKSTRRPVF